MSQDEMDTGGDRMTTTRAETASSRATVLRWGGLTAYASGAIAAVGIVFLVAMFASFAVGAKSPGMAFGRINDVLVMVSYALAAPIVVALHLLLRPTAPRLSALAAVIGMGGLAAIVFLQLLLVVGALTFDEQIGLASLVYLFLAAWFITTGYLGSSSGILPRGVLMGFLAATYVGYPIWAIWLARHLLRRAETAEHYRLATTTKGSHHV